MDSWSDRFVKVFQKYLKERGVSYASHIKAGLVFLRCKQADTLGLVVDPDGLIEDRNYICDTKLQISYFFQFYHNNS